MNWNVAEKDWQELRQTARERWNKLTDDHSDVITDKREHLIAELQEAYGVDRTDAESEIIAFEMQYGRFRPSQSMRSSNRYRK
ncbi:MAG TPA: hypothetical protein VHL14_11765 [Steroidobacteraceae bacterium]|nr:hypothetical protein [Steroidobacteraceae bacterium]